MAIRPMLGFPFRCQNCVASVYGRFFRINNGLIESGSGRLVVELRMENFGSEVTYTKPRRQSSLRTHCTALCRTGGMRLFAPQIPMGKVIKSCKLPWGQNKKLKVTSGDIEAVRQSRFGQPETHLRRQRYLRYTYLTILMIA